jgi:outer membrane protein assembly factor BamB
MRIFRERGRVAAVLVSLLAMTPGRPCNAATAVTTYHYDNGRTGWNPAETALTPATVASAGFGLLAQVKLDEQVDAQPLYMPGETIAGGVHNVVYVATENNTVYAIDADAGTVLLSTNLGPPVPYTSLPAQCINNSNNVGINSTPVIDPAAGVMYVMAYTNDSTGLTYRLHELNLATLADAAPPVVVGATGTMSNGTTFPFYAAYQRQRPALLLANGNVYAAFGSFCDAASQISRGWMLGWNAGTLAPVVSTELTNKRPRSAYTFFLTSIWMSGAGPAADDLGNIYFSTGNSDWSGTSYNRLYNPSVSMVILPPDLSAIAGVYTAPHHKQLDIDDDDLSSGGVLLLPPQAGAFPHLAVAAGKPGNLYLLDLDRITAASQKGAVLGYYPNNGCWCSESFYTGSDLAGRLVTSTGAALGVWRLKFGLKPVLKPESASAGLQTGPDAGFFTSVSSNGTVPDTAVIWAVLRPLTADSTHTVTLAAFDPAAALQQLFSAPAGNWPFTGDSNANIVPVVADGHVFVATYGSLAIFGLTPGLAHVAARVMPVRAARAPSGAAHQWHGIAQAVDGNLVSLRLRNGTTAIADMAAAVRLNNMAEPVLGRGVLVRGNRFDAVGHLVATSVLHLKNDPTLWPPDS